jgi:hypothetical protein
VRLPLFLPTAYGSTWRCWSATTDATDPLAVWTVFGVGLFQSEAKDTNHRARAVRGGL